MSEANTTCSLGREVRGRGGAYTEKAGRRAFSREEEEEKAKLVAQAAKGEQRTFRRELLEKRIFNFCPRARIWA